MEWTLADKLVNKAGASSRGALKKVTLKCNRAAFLCTLDPRLAAMDSNLKRKPRTPTSAPNLSKKWQEKYHMRRWIKAKGNEYISKYRYVPLLILGEYEKALQESEIQFNAPFTTDERVWYIRELIHWHVNILPPFLKLLKTVGMNQSQFAKALGYCNASAFYNSSKKLKLAEGFLNVFESFHVIQLQRENWDR